MTDEVLVFDRYPSNAGLIVALARLGYLREDMAVLDPTWGEGTFWRAWTPRILWGSDLVERKSPSGESVDFRKLPWPDRSWRAVVFDGPYKLNGKPDPEVDDRYGVGSLTRWQDRMQLLREGVVECARVADEMLLVKCQDQVCSGKKRWQTRELADLAEAQGFRLLDMLHIEGGRPQPEFRNRCPHDPKHPRGQCPDPEKVKVVQVHALQNFSTMLVLRRVK